jgi:hypothetical protein
MGFQFEEYRESDLGWRASLKPVQTDEFTPFGTEFLV